MRLYNILFGNKELKNSFVDLKTTFLLDSDKFEGGGAFKNTKCLLLKTVKYKGKNYYLFETDQDFSGFPFGVKEISINKFFLVIRNPSIFSKSENNDVIIYLTENISNRLENPENLIKNLTPINWAIIHDINV